MHDPKCYINRIAYSEAILVTKPDWNKVIIHVQRNVKKNVLLQSVQSSPIQFPVDLLDFSDSGEVPPIAQKLMCNLIPWIVVC